MDERDIKARKAEHIAQEFDIHGPLTINDWMMLAWAREIPELLPMPSGEVLNLGAGNRQIGASIDIGLETGWDADAEVIPFDNDSVAGIYAHGFFEHLKEPIRILQECQRVLVWGGVLNIVVPHGMSELWTEDLTHQHRFHEHTFRNLFGNPYYAMGGEEEWQLRVHTSFIMATDYRNLALFAQLIKG